MLLLEDDEEVIRCLTEIFLLSNFWERNVGWEPLDGDAVAGGLSVGDVHFVTSVVLQRRSNVEAVITMDRERSTLCWGLVSDDPRSRDSKRSSVKIEVAKKTSISRKFWLSARRSEQIQRDVALRD